MNARILLAVVLAGSVVGVPPAGAAAVDPYGGPIIAAAMSTMMSDPAQSLMLARRVAMTTTDPLDQARARWLQGEALSRLGRSAEARPLLEAALDTVRRIAPRNELLGNILLSRGWIEETSGAIAPALNDFQQAYGLLRELGEARSEAKALQNIAGIYQDAGDNERALRYYSEASEVYHDDPSFSVAAHNNVGESLRLLGRYGEAEHQFVQALLLAAKNSPALQTNVLTNLAWTRLLNGNVVGASTDAKRALALSVRSGAAEEQPFIFGVLAMIAERRGDLPNASRLISRTFAGLDPTATPLPYRVFHQLAADIYARTGRSDLAFAHLTAFKRLDDGVRALAASTNASLMAAQFDFSNQNLRITQLQANRARLHELVLVLAVVAVSIISALLSLGLLSLGRSRNRVRAANGQLSEANRSLELALKVKSDFLAMTSHEIRTPLNGILGMTQVLLADGATAGPLRTRVQVIHSAGETMRALVDDILDLSKMETGMLVVARSPLRLPLLLEEIANLWQGQAEAKQLDLVLDARDCPPLIDEDGDRLRQVLTNLLSNAMKFTDRGGVTLSAGVQSGSAGEELHIAVRDTGIGIAPEQHDLVFEKFTQADASTSRSYGGTGLGLAICRNIAHALDGRIELASELGSGSTFTLVLPSRRIEQAPAAAPEADREQEQAKLLVLEPNALNQRVMTKALASTGVVSCVTTGAMVLEALDRVRFDHLVLQGAAVSLAELDLSASLERIIRHAEGRNCAVTVMLGPDDGVAPDRLYGAQLLMKPVSGDRLRAAVEVAWRTGPVRTAA